MPERRPPRRDRALLAAALILAALLDDAPAAATEPFANNTLFAGREVKQSTGTRTWEAGLRFEIAPIRQVAQAGIRDYVDRHDEIQPVYEYAQAIDPHVLASGSAAEIVNAMLKIEWLDDSDRSTIRRVFQDAEQAQVDQVVTTLHQLAGLLADEETAVAFSLSPYFLYNFKYVDITVEFPLAGFVTEADSDLTIGNLNADLRFGHHFGDDVAVGFSYGIAVFLPTAGERAETLALQNALEAPRFVHHYLTLAPYVGAGLDLWGIAKIQTHMELLDLLGVRDNPARTVGVAFRWGVSLILAVFDVFAVNVELDGAVDLKDAPDFDALYLTGGLRGNIYGVKLGAAVQTPLNLVTGSGLSTREEAIANAAEVNVVVTLGFAW